MNKLLLSAVLLAGTALSAPASAATLTGSYTATLSSDANASLHKDLGSPFSLTLGAPRSDFVRVDPFPLCFTGCNPDTGTITVTFSNLKVDGVAVPGGGTFTETGLYSAFYGTQIDNVRWAGATAQSGFGLDQDGNIPLVYSFLIPDGPNGLLHLNLVDGADWNVQTYVEANLTAVPLPPAVALFMAGMVGIGALRRFTKKSQPMESLNA